MSRNGNIEREKIIIEAGVLVMTLLFLIAQISGSISQHPISIFSIASGSILFAASVGVAVWIVFFPPGSLFRDRFLVYFEGLLFVSGVLVLLVYLVVLVLPHAPDQLETSVIYLALVAGLLALAAIIAFLRAKEYTKKSKREV